MTGPLPDSETPGPGSAGTTTDAAANAAPETAPQTSPGPTSAAGRAAPRCPLPPFAEWQADPVLPDWLSRPHMARKDAAVRRAMLQQKLWKTDPVSRLARRRAWVDDWSRARGLPAPGTLAGPFPLQDLPLHLEGRDSGVIKPLHATNACAVFPFTRTGPFEIRNR